MKRASSVNIFLLNSNQTSKNDPNLTYRVISAIDNGHASLGCEDSVYQKTR